VQYNTKPDERARTLTLCCNRSTVRVFALETSLWKHSAGFEPSFLVDIGNWLAGQGPSVSNTARRRRSKFLLFFSRAARASHHTVEIGVVEIGDGGGPICTVQDNVRY